MNINIPPGEQAKLSQLAVEAGYDDVEVFVTEYVLSLAYNARNELPPLREEQLQASLAMCDQGMAEFAGGGGRDAREVMLEIGRRHGLSLE